MKWSTPWLALVGHRGAILEAAGTRWTLLVGGLLVLSASLARKYDTMDLLAQPHELLHGVAAAMVNAMGLHLLFWLFSKDRPRVGFVRSYLAVLGVFMLAAPMGWVYGVPYEHLMPAPDAIRANLWSLAAVSVVRVVWMTRVMNVLWGVEGMKGCIGTFFAVMVYCDAVAIVALTTMPLPTLDVMGGLQQPEEDRIVAMAAFTAGFFAVTTAIIWLLAGGASLVATRRRWVASPALAGRTPVGAIVVAAVAVAAWAALLPAFQPKLQNRTRYERLVKAERYREAIDELCAKSRSDYPPVWAPGPRDKYGSRDSEDQMVMGDFLRELTRRAEAEGIPAWVGEVYGAKLIWWCSGALWSRGKTVAGPTWGDRRRSSEPSSKDEREWGWEQLGEKGREPVRLGLRFVERRMGSLTEEQRASVRWWLEGDPGDKPAGGG